VPRGAGSVVAVDVGGTAIKAAHVDAGGRAHHAVSVPTPVAEGPEAVVRAIRGTVTALAGGADAVGVAIVVPGTVDVGAGVAGFAANLGWHDVPLRALVQADTGLPTLLDRDAHAAGTAELTLGAAGAATDSLIAVIGTGIVAVITAAGRPVPGALGLAGEFGHLPVWPDGEDCPCGQRGCLELYASAAAIGRRYQAATGCGRTRSGRWASPSPRARCCWTRR
jgi:glucokinase